MFVFTNYRGQKIGTANQLRSCLVSWDRSKNVQKFYLGTTEKFKAAHRFYDQKGFSEINKSDSPATFPLMQVDTRFYKLSFQ